MFHLFEKIPLIAISAFGAWAVYAQVLVLADRSFEDLIGNVWVVVVLGTVFYISLFRTQTSVVAGPRPLVVPSFYRMTLLAAVSSIAVGLLLPAYQIIGVLAYGIIVVVLLKSVSDDLLQNVAPHNHDPATEWEKWILVLVSIAAAGLTLFLHRANWDDAYYVNAIAHALDHPALPLLKYDGMHGVPGLETNQVAWRLQTYELLVAAGSHLFKVDHRDLFYLYLPSIWAFLSVPAHWLLARRLCGRGAGPAVLIIFLLLIAWGEGGRTFGSFSYINLSQGKAIFLTVFMPLVINAALGYAEKPGMRSWLCLVVTCFSASMFTSNAYVVIPAAVGLTLVAACGFSRSGIKQIITGCTATLYAPVVVWLLMHNVVQPDVDGIKSDFYVFSGTQGKIILIMMGVTPFLAVLAKLQGAKWLTRYCLLFFVLFFSGLFLPTIAQITSKVFSWRLLWAVPVPTIVGVGGAALGLLIHRAWRQNEKLKSYALACFALMIVMAVVISGRPSLRVNNLHWPATNVRYGFDAAQKVLQMSTPEDVVLAPYAISVPLVGFRGAPSVVVARSHYLSRLTPQWGEAETARRKLLLKIIRGKLRGPDDIAWAKQQLTMGDVTKVIIRNDNPELEALRAMLKSIGATVHTIRSWEVWSLREVETENVK